MSTKARDIIATVAQEWSSIQAPNRPGELLADQFQLTLDGFVKERGRMAFEAEPSTFENALLRNKDVN